MAKAIKGLDTFALYLFPFVLLVLNAAFVHVTESLFAVIATIHIESAIPENDCVISSLTWHLSALKLADVEPLLQG